MDNSKFTAEERNLMCIYDTSSRMALVKSLVQVQCYLEGEMQEYRVMTEDIIRMLLDMTDEEFGQVDLVPDFEPDVEEEE